ncbi:MAG: hypothetical protein ACI8SN_000234 [Algoriphagus sp.]|jgi:hypothetical protein
MLCPSCGLELIVDNQKSVAALNALNKLQSVSIKLQKSNQNQHSNLVIPSSEFPGLIVLIGFLNFLLRVHYKWALSYH